MLQSAALQCMSPFHCHNILHRICDAYCLHVVEQRHESEIHVQLLMPVKQRHAVIVSLEIERGFV
jgi:hypothetical protein